VLFHSSHTAYPSVTNHTSLTATVRGWSVEVQNQTDPFWYYSSTETCVTIHLAVVYI